jgi:1,2-diacylglycerol 3-beta-galactosyltransferase
MSMDTPHMTRVATAPPAGTARVILILTADTGGGHRAAADAIRQELHSRHAAELATITCDPLVGPGARRVTRWLCRRYGPLIRIVPPAWSLLFHVSNTRPGFRVLRSLFTRSVSGSVATAIRRHRPAAVVVTHPLLVAAAVAAREVIDPTPYLMTVVTDLGTIHRAWWHPSVDQVVVPTPRQLPAARAMHGKARASRAALGVPVRQQFRTGPLRQAARADLRALLGMRPCRFVVLVMSGAEGARGMKAWTKAILASDADVDVVAVCGRNERLRSDLRRLAARTHGRLTVLGFVENLADWLRCADVVLTKAGPGIIAEAASCGTPMLLASHLAGQETGNTEIVVEAGAGRRVRGPRQIAREIESLRSNRLILEQLRSAAVDLGRALTGSAVTDILAEQLGIRFLASGSRPQRPLSKGDPVMNDLTDCSSCSDSAWNEAGFW